MSNDTKWILPEGIEELSPQRAAQVEAARRQLLDLYRLWGYELVMPPVIDFIESLLTGTGHDLDLQTFKLVDSLTVMQNLLMVGSFAKRPIKEANEKARFYLEQSGVAHLSSAWPAKLSQGEKQRVAGARALANGAELIIADEPTGSLSSEQGMAIIRYLKHIADTEQRTIVIASHDQRIKEYSNNVFQLSDGKLGMIK